MSEESFRAEVVDRDYVGLKETARRMGLRPSALLRIAEAGDVPCCWWGNSPLFSDVELRRWLSDPAYTPQNTLDWVDEDDGRPVPYQRTDGRWSVRILCPDGVERRFISRRREPIAPEHQRQSKPRAPLSPTLRFKVFRRDDFTCRYCGRRPPQVVLEVDHAISVADGGADEEENLVTACSDCNIGKRDHSIGPGQVPTGHQRVSILPSGVVSRREESSRETEGHAQSSQD